MEVSIVIRKGMPSKTCVLGIRLRHVCPSAITRDIFDLVIREMQTESEKRFREWEEERWKREHELEERWRREDREHERLTLQMFLWSQQPTYSNYSHTYQHPMYQSFDEED